jgi:hypothetical protein
MQTRLIRFLLCTIIILISHPGFSQAHIWSKGIKGKNNNNAYDMYVDAAGNSFVTGYFNDTADFDPSPAQYLLSTPAGYGGFIAKYNTSGALVWAKALTGQGFCIGYGITLNMNGDIIITGRFSDTVDFDPSVNTANQICHGNDDIFLACYSPQGNYKWCSRMGGNYNDEGREVCTDSAGRIYITGYFRGNSDFDPSPTLVMISSMSLSLDMFIGCYDSTGSYNWAKKVTGPLDEVGESIHIHSGQLLIGGKHEGQSDFDPGVSNTNTGVFGDGNAFMASYDLSGNFNWVNSLGGTGDNDLINTITTNAVGEIYVCGRYGGPADFDPSSAVYNLNSLGFDDGFLAKYSSGGNFIWAIPVSAPWPDEGTDMTVTPAGDVWVCGFLRDSADFDPGAGVDYAVADNSLTNSFLANYSSNGTYQWAFTLFGGENFAFSIGLDADTNIYVCGNYIQTVDFDPSAGTANLNNAMYSDMFIAKYRTGPIQQGNPDAVEEVINENLMIFPNPSSGIFSVVVDDESQVRIFNLQGEEVWQSVLSRGTQKIDITHLPSGMYLIENVTLETRVKKTARIIKQ